MPERQLETVNKDFISDHELMNLSKRVVQNYVQKGSIPSREMEDIQMSIIEKFLAKKTKIVERFEGNSRVETYCIAILNRMCCEIIRRDIKHWNIQENNQLQRLDSSDSNQITTIKDEIAFLGNIILMLGEDSAKVKLFLTYYFQLSLFQVDLDAYAKNLAEEANGLLKISIEPLSKGEIFIQLAKLVNLIEHKDLKSDAIRMWLNKHIQKIIQRLNGPYFRAHYDKESFQILFEYYHQYLLAKEDKAT